MKKVIIFLVIMLVLFGGVGVLTYMQNLAPEDNVYQKNTLDPATTAQLDDPNYQNIILPDELEEKLDNGEDATVYFYSPTCQFCQQTTPIVSPLTEEMGVDLVQYNLLEFEQGWDDFNISETPTIVQFKAGEETARITGLREETVFEDWFNENSK
ncbi:thioredoxin family protein [Cytobacillus gottheilii]|uniref:thioredoxin family protein n=1 Tax=Cytobacillus gottheilii TaxID=859144 RepID=UPI0009BBE8E7|nr:thioredoxin family protein [Cytobacillus gottheilii]